MRRRKTYTLLCFSVGFVFFVVYEWVAKERGFPRGFPRLADPVFTPLGGPSVFVAWRGIGPLLWQAAYMVMIDDI